MTKRPIGTLMYGVQKWVWSNVKPYDLPTMKLHLSVDSKILCTDTVWQPCPRFNCVVSFPYPSMVLGSANETSCIPIIRDSKLCEAKGYNERYIWQMRLAWKEVWVQRTAWNHGIKPRLLLIRSRSRERLLVDEVSLKGCLFQQPAWNHGIIWSQLSQGCS